MDKKNRKEMIQRLLMSRLDGFQMEKAIMQNCRLLSQEEIKNLPREISVILKEMIGRIDKWVERKGDEEGKMKERKEDLELNGSFFRVKIFSLMVEKAVEEKNWRKAARYSYLAFGKSSYSGLKFRKVLS
jgi:hypothetical protein